MIHTIFTRVPVLEKGPMFYLVHETSPGGAWTSVPYWFPDVANNKAAKLKAEGKLAFVEAR